MPLRCALVGDGSQTEDLAELAGHARNRQLGTCTSLDGRRIPSRAWRALVMLCSRRFRRVWETCSSRPWLRSVPGHCQRCSMRFHPRGALRRGVWCYRAPRRRGCACGCDHRAGSDKTLRDRLRVAGRAQVGSSTSQSSCRRTRRSSPLWCAREREDSQDEKPTSAPEVHAVEFEDTRWAAAIHGWRGSSLALAIAILAWTGLKVASAPVRPLSVDVGSDKLITGWVSYDSVVPGAGSSRSAIASGRLRVRGAAARDTTVSLEPMASKTPRAKGRRSGVYSVVSSLNRCRARVGPRSRCRPLGPSSPVPRLMATGAPVALEVPLQAAGYIEVDVLKHPWSGTSGATDGASRTVIFTTRRHYGHLPSSSRYSNRVQATYPHYASVRGYTSDPHVRRRSQTPETERAELSGPSPWHWRPSDAGLGLGPGVRLVSVAETGTLLKIEGQTGSISFPLEQTRSYWLPTAKEVALAALTGVWPSSRSLRLRGTAASGEYCDPTGLLWPRCSSRRSRSPLP